MRALRGVDSFINGRYIYILDTVSYFGPTLDETTVSEEAMDLSVLEQ